MPKRSQPKRPALDRPPYDPPVTRPIGTSPLSAWLVLVPDGPHSLRRLITLHSDGATIQDVCRVVARDHDRFKVGVLGVGLYELGAPQGQCYIPDTRMVNHAGQVVSIDDPF